MNEHTIVDKATGRSVTRGVAVARSVRLLLLLLPCVGIPIAALAYGAHLRGSRTLAHAADGQPIAVSRGTADRPPSSLPIPTQQPEGFFIVIRPQGFEPKELTGDSGRFLFAVDNRSGLEAVQLRLDRLAGERLNDVRVPREKLDWRAFIDLTPGRYILTEANHPDWQCSITINPR